MAAFKKDGVMLGIGPRKQGIGKNGPYDFCEVFIGFPRKNWEGLYVVHDRIPGETLDRLPLITGVDVRCLIYYENYNPSLIDILEVVVDA